LSHVHERNNLEAFEQTRICLAGFCCALALHVTDEALTGFLSAYNPTVLALRVRFGFWRCRPSTFVLWLTALIIGIVVLVALSPFAFRNARWIRLLSYFLAIFVGIFNALGHTLATIFGHTVSSVRFPRPAPGFYSSPFLFAAAGLSARCNFEEHFTTRTRH